MSKIQGQAKETPATLKIVITVSCIVAFLIVSYVFFSWLRAILVTPNVAAVLSLLSGTFIAFLIMALSGLVREFSIKSPLFAISSKLEEQIKNVQSEVTDSKKEIGDKILGLTQTIQNVQSIVSTNTVNSRMNQSTSLNFGDLVKEITNLVDRQKSKIISDAGIGKEFAPSKVNLPLGIKKNIRGAEMRYKKGIEEIQRVVNNISKIDVEGRLQEANLSFYAGSDEEL